MASNGAKKEDLSSIWAEKPKGTMEYRRLGNTGLKVSVLCLGAMTFNIGENTTNGWKMPTATEKVSHQILDDFVAAGGNFIDTANVYTNSEKVIGNWLAAKPNPKEFRRKLIIATKFRSPMGDDVNSKGASRKHIADAVEQSLRDLQTDYIDLYQQHAYDKDTPMHETMYALNDLVRSGKVHYIGISNFAGWHIMKAVDIARHEHLIPYVTLQQQYSLLARSIEWDSLEVCVQEGLGVLPWSPLCGGLLSGKFTRESKDESDTRAKWADAAGWKETALTSKDPDHFYRIVDELIAIGKELSAPVAAVALRWVVQKKGVSSVIIGAKTVEQLKENLAAATVRLTEEHMERLDKASATPLPYPFNLIAAR